MNNVYNHKFKILILLMLPVCLLIVYLHVNTPKPNAQYNLKEWKLDDSTVIMYYEKWDGHSGFTGNIQQYITIKTQGKCNNYMIGIGGSYNRIQLFESKNNKIVWLRGSESIFNKSNVIAVINMSNNVVLDRYKFLWKREDLSNDEIKLMDAVQSEQGVQVRGARNIQ